MLVFTPVTWLPTLSLLLVRTTMMISTSGALLLIVSLLSLRTPEVTPLAVELELPSTSRMMPSNSLNKRRSRTSLKSTLSSLTTPSAFSSLRMSRKKSLMSLKKRRLKNLLRVMNLREKKRKIPKTRMKRKTMMSKSRTKEKRRKKKSLKWKLSPNRNGAGNTLMKLKLSGCVLKKI